MKKSIGSILKLASELPDVSEKIKCLQANNHPSLLLVLRYCYDPKIKWLLPKGKIDFKPAKSGGLEHMLYQEAQRLYIFIEGGNDDLKPEQRQKLFVRLLEQLCEEDAKLLMSIKDKKLPYRGLTSTIVKKAFSGLY